MVEQTTSRRVFQNGGANYFYRSVSGSNITGTYTNNKAERIGGANHFYNEVSGSNVSGTYTNNTAGRSGGANRFEESVSNSTVSGTYTNNTANTGGGANYFLNSVSGSNVSGIYINNTASNSAIIYFNGGSVGLDANIINGIFLNNNCSYEVYSRTPGVVVKDSWFGNNASNYWNKPHINENVTIDNWLFLNTTSDTNLLRIGECAKITFDLYSYRTSGQISKYDGPIDIQLDLTQTLGELDKDAASLGEEVVYTAKELGGAGVTGTFITTTCTIALTNFQWKRNK